MPETPVQLLLDALEKYVQKLGAVKAFDLGAYQRLARNQAVSGQGLAHNFDLLGSILGLGCRELSHSVANAR